MATNGPPVKIRGRGATANPPNRFERIEFEPDAEALAGSPPERTQYFRDSTRTAITRNNSPDVGFDYSVNPYRGCEHGCIYCYARPTHEYFGMSAGLDFETKILVKEEAPELLRRELSSPKWRPAPIIMSGVTDPYQPIERRLELTRRCLAVLADFRNPVAIITKNQLVMRDLDLLGQLAADSAAVVNISITTLDSELQRVMEPRTSSPVKRLAAVADLAAAGVRVGVMVAPVIPGLTDHELPAILKAAAAAGASSAGFIPLRLPHGVSRLFEDWLATHFPERKSKVLGRVRQVRGGRLNDPRFGSRMRGEGPHASNMRDLFHAACQKYGLKTGRAELSAEAWRGPASAGAASGGGAQLTLF